MRKISMYTLSAAAAMFVSAAIPVDITGSRIYISDSFC